MWTVKGQKIGDMKVSDPPVNRQDVGGISSIAVDPSEQMTIVVGTKRGEVIKIVHGKYSDSFMCSHSIIGYSHSSSQIVRN